MCFTVDVGMGNTVNLYNYLQIYVISEFYLFTEKADNRCDKYVTLYTLIINVLHFTLINQLIN